MRSFFTAVLLFVVSLLSAVPPSQDPIGEAAGKIQATAGSVPLDLNDRIEVFAEVDSLSADSLWARIQSGKAHRIDEKIAVGFTEAYHWILFSIADSSLAPQILELKNPQIDVAELYRVLGDSTESLGLAGDAVALSKHTVPNRHPVFELHPTEPESVYLLKIDKRNSSLFFPLNLWPVEAYHRAELRHHVFYGILLGLMGLAFLFSAVFSAYFRSRTFLYYCGYSLGSIGYVLATSGYLFVIFHPEHPEFTTYTRPLTLVIAWLFLLPFSRHYFQLKNGWPAAHRFLLGVQAVFLTLFLLWGVFPKFYIEHIPWVLSTLYFLLMVSGVGLAVIALRDYSGNRWRSSFFLTAFMMIFIATPLGIGVEYGLLNPRYFSANQLIPLILLEVFFLAAGMFYRFQQMWRERVHLRKTTHLVQREKDLLERELEQRNRELPRVSGYWELANHKLHWDAIRYIQTDGHYLEIYCVDRSKPILERYRLSEAISDLPTDLFMRIHRGTVVGTRHIVQVGTQFVRLDDGVKLAVSKTYWPEVRAFKPLVLSTD